MSHCRHEPDGRCWAVDARDTSPAVDMRTYDGGRYNARCSWCWLGYSHTVNEHERKLAEARP